jgi:hypothetical protein
MKLLFKKFRQEASTNTQLCTYVGTTSAAIPPQYFNRLSKRPLSRVTRLGEFFAYGAIFYFGQFFLKLQN